MDKTEAETVEAASRRLRRALRDARMQGSLTLDQVKGRMGKGAVSSLSDWESGSGADLRLSNLLRWAAALGMTIEFRPLGGRPRNELYQALARAETERDELRRLVRGAIRAGRLVEGDTPR